MSKVEKLEQQLKNSQTENAYLRKMIREFERDSGLKMVTSVRPTEGAIDSTPGKQLSFRF